MTTRTAVTGKVEKFLGTVTDRQIRVVASDGSVDRMGDILEPSGAELDDFRRNPVVLAQHDVNQPVARCKSIKAEADKITALIEFPAAGVSELADEYCRLYKSGILNAVSVGFLPLDWKPLPHSGGRRYTRWELLELSLVSVPANANALVIERGLSSSSNAVCEAEMLHAADHYQRAARLAELASPKHCGAPAEPRAAAVAICWDGGDAQRPG